MLCRAKLIGSRSDKKKLKCVFLKYLIIIMAELKAACIQEYMNVVNELHSLSMQTRQYIPSLIEPTPLDHDEVDWIRNIYGYDPDHVVIMTNHYRVYVKNTRERLQLCQEKLVLCEK